MQSDEVYPYLFALLGGYFHQDAWDEGDTVEDIIEEYKRTSQPYEQLGARADIARYLDRHQDDPNFLATLERVFSPSVVTGEDDAAARAWLKRLLGLLDH